MFARWLQAATDSGAKDATAMALATVGPDGSPSVRIVLLKHFDGRGFCWYSDDRSRKGAELVENPRASAVFYWRDFDRQVRISGTVEKLAAETSEAYFLSRPEESRYAAAASVQSAPVGRQGGPGTGGGGPARAVSGRRAAAAGAVGRVSPVPG